MTREKAIKALGLMEQIESIVVTYEPGEQVEDTSVHELKEACHMAVAALRAQPKKLDKSRWKGCWSCNNQKVRSMGLRHGQEYCPCCGKHLTGKAWEELERRIGGNDGTANS